MDTTPALAPPEAKDCASAALRSIRGHGLAVTPHTFAVWYEYHRGSLPELNRVLDIVLSNNVGLDDDRFASLHAKFLGAPQAYLALRGTSQRIQQTIADVLALLQNAGQDASRFGAAVRQVSGQFATQEVSIEHLIRGLLGEAREIVVRSEQMEAELARNAELMKSLQQTG